MKLLLLAVFCAFFQPIHSTWCDNPLMEGSEIVATSSLSGKEAKEARLFGDSAWTARFSNVGQSITVDLGEVYRITRVATQGRRHSREFVRQYSLQYGFNGRDFMDYRGPHGGAWGFQANTNDNSVVSNRLEVPVVAQYIRIRPTRWNERMSLRMELYGCTFTATTMYFTGEAFVEKDLSRHQVHSYRDSIQFRFRTDRANGVLMYSRGAQGDLFAVQLVRDKLLLLIDLGSGRPTSLSVGSLLDDHLWHDVSIERHERDVSLTVDRVRVTTEISGEFRRLDLNSKFYLGGVPYIKDGVQVFSNFTGCIENFYLNSSNFIAELRQGNRDDFSSYGALANCPAVHVVPLTFQDRGAHIKVVGNEGQTTLNISFSFRTYERDGMLAFHNFLSDGYVKVYLQAGRFKVAIMTTGMKQPVVLDAFEQRYNDGSWHAAIVALATNRATTILDGYPTETRRLMKFTTGFEYLFGGGLPGSENPGFLGCIRSISAGGNEHSPLQLGPQNMMKSEFILIDACDMEDRCNPNPCEHGGLCTQTSQEFVCDCSGTGYTGAVCHAATNPLSCAQYFMHNRGSRRARVAIDVDGSGPLAAFPVSCVLTPEGQVETHLDHDALGDQIVDGFDRRGSYVRNIDYDADMRQIDRLINGSLSCRQQLFYACYNARLFNSPVRLDEPFEPYSWWVSRNNEMMDYWGGSQPGSRKCACGIQGTCIDRAKDCNCDAGVAETADGGDLMFKEDLPVRRVHFGDTGAPGDSRRGTYRVGSLVCEGDAVFDNTVTFRLSDATIDLPPIEMGYSGDIFFEFRTTKESGTFLHVEGPEDFLKVSIVGGNSIQLEYRVGSIPLSVTVEVSSRLNDDRWHSVFVERNRKQARVLLDNSLHKHTDEPEGPVRPIKLTSKLIVGANTKYSNGFVGCMRALMVNGRLQNLKYLAERGVWSSARHGSVYRGPLYGVSVGCQGKCASSPCLNNGTCIEGYSDYECNCRWTAFKGPICADEIGVSMTRSYMIKYELEGSYKSTIAENIRVGFTTTSPSGFLMGLISSVTQEFMTIMISNSGSLRVVFDFGFERRDVVYPERIFNEGQFHDVRVRRLNGGSTLEIQVDDYPAYQETFNVNPSADVQFNNIQYLYIGKNESMQEGFVGCISRVEFDDIYPLKLMFQENRPSNINGSSPKIHEDYCGIEPVRHPEEEQEQRPPPEVDEDIVSSLYNDINFAVLGGILAALLLLALLITIMVVRRLSRRKGDYMTREDAGASDAEDADEAVTQGETGAQVQKMREFFI
ncbi:neurexin-4-like [Amphibalanus amphitrite]|uniref:neurexin-4-like n=1 Tax=Amphibalanus amphitrite TaxID=1232801 RepID=UPI001C9106F6|nr:neurexin-4-like [Amphibalanus amphitrite]